MISTPVWKTLLRPIKSLNLEWLWQSRTFYIRSYRLAFRDIFLLKVFQVIFGVFEPGLSTLSLCNDLFQVQLFSLQPHQILLHNQNTTWFLCIKYSVYKPKQQQKIQQFIIFQSSKFLFFALTHAHRFQTHSERSAYLLSW